MVLLSPVFCFEMLFVPLKRYMYLIFLQIGIHAECGLMFIDKCLSKNFTYLNTHVHT